MKRAWIIGMLLGLTGCQWSLPDGVMRLERPDEAVYVISSDDIMNAIEPGVRPDFSQVLQPAMRYARLHPSLKISITAYGNDVLSQRYGKALYDFQAETVASYLWAHGIDSARLAYQGSKPGTDIVNSNRWPNTAKDNRRVEIVFHR